MPARICAALAAALVPVSSASAAWTTPFPVNSVNGDAGWPVAMEPGGRAYVVWRDFQAGGQVVMGRARATSGALSVE